MKLAHARMIAWPIGVLIFLWGSGYGEKLWWQARLFAVEPSLSAAGMDGRVWSGNQVSQAMLVSRKQLSALGDRLAAAADQGDQASAFIVMDEATKVLSDWNDQGDEAKQLGRGCVLAALQVLRGVDDVFANGPWSGKSMFSTALKHCG